MLFPVLREFSPSRVSSAYLTYNSRERRNEYVFDKSAHFFKHQTLLFSYCSAKVKELFLFPTTWYKFRRGSEACKMKVTTYEQPHGDPLVN